MLIKEKTIWTPDNSYLLEYRERAAAGDIIIGQELRQELDNLKADFPTIGIFTIPTTLVCAWISWKIA